MLASFKRGYNFLAARPVLRFVLQAGVSLLLIAALVRGAQQSNVLESFQRIQPEALVFAVGLLFVGYVINSYRWQLLLQNVGIHERLSYLTRLYLIGQFFSLFLPTGTGGDAIRVYEVARRNQRTAQAIVATLQERLVGLGASLLIGLVATLYYLPLVPLQLRIWTIVIQVVGALGITLLLYPVLLAGVVQWFWRWQGHRPILQRWVEKPVCVRVISAIHPIVDLPPLRPLRLVWVLSVATIAIFLGIGMYAVLGQALDISTGFMAFCLVVPMVWIIRMVPVSLNGVGLSEGSFVFLMGLFAVPAGKALALALAVLGIQTGFALVGGLLAALRVARGTWVSTRQPVPDDASAGAVD